MTAGPPAGDIEVGLDLAALTGRVEDRLLDRDLDGGTAREIAATSAGAP